MNPYRFVSNEKLTTSGGAASNSTAAGATITCFRVATRIDCYVNIGTSVTATSSSMFMPSGVVEYFKVAPGERVSVIAVSDEGEVTVTSMSS